MDFKNILKKTWHFIWYEDSLASWLVNVILAFIIVKFIIYPVLGLLLGTSYPVVAVVSCSMEHNKNLGECSFTHSKFEKWWTQEEQLYKEYDIIKNSFRDYKFKNGFNKGDIMILVSAKNLKVGDVIVFNGVATEPIIHRIIKINDDGSYQTKGDNNNGSRNDEMRIIKNNILGKAIFKIPYLGWIKLGFINLINLIMEKA